MTLLAPTSASPDTTERGYQWYLANLAEIRLIIETDTRLDTLLRSKPISVCHSAPPSDLKNFTQKLRPFPRMKRNDTHSHGTHIMPPWILILASPVLPMPIKKRLHRQSF